MADRRRIEDRDQAQSILNKISGHDRTQMTHYYRPYDSAEESDASSEGFADSSDSDSWSSSGTERSIQGGPNYVSLAQELARLSGPTISTNTEDKTLALQQVEQQITPEQNPSTIQYGGTSFKTETTNETSIILVDSLNRDRTAYPQPTNCTFRLPRIYKNVKAITLAEVKLLTSFYFFQYTKGNCDITIHEKDRLTDYGDGLQSTLVTTYIYEGSFNINSLQAELEVELNYTPPFYDFINGFEDFIPKFSTSGDFSIMFNQPGDTFYDNVTNTYLPNPTMDQIVSYFWKSKNANLTFYSQDQLLIGFYYPPLKLAVLDTTGSYPTDFIDLTYGIGIDPTVQTEDDVYQRIVFTFTGLNDPVVLGVINGNLDNIEAYRIQHTFRYWLVNKYQVSRNQQLQRVYITSPGLNTSLVRLFAIREQQYFLQALSNNNVTATQYSNLRNNLDRYKAIANDMYSFEQLQFATYFAVPYNQYSLNYYSDLDNPFYLRYSKDVVSTPINNQESFAAGIQTYSTNIFTVYNRNDPTYYWPNMTNLDTQDSQFMMNQVTTDGTSSFINIYEPSNNQINTEQPFIDSVSSRLYIQRLTKSMNVITPIQAGKYSVFQFHSKYRQTLQIETLSRPTAYRLPTYNTSNYNSTINYYFNIPYEYSSNPETYPYRPLSEEYSYIFDNIDKNTLFIIPGWDSDTTTFGTTLDTSIDYYTSNIQFTVLNTYQCFFAEFTTPSFPDASPNSNYTFTMGIYIEFYDDPILKNPTLPSEPFTAFLYHDRGAFQGDALFNRKESEYFYKYSTIITDTNASIEFTAYPNQTYYILLRPDSIVFPTNYLRIAPYFPTPIVSTVQSLSIDGLNPETDPFSSSFQDLVTSNFNYAQVYDSNWIRLPSSSNLWPPDPKFNPANINLSIYATPIGYDTNGVSTDYTSFIPFKSNSPTDSFAPYQKYAIDPVNSYIFLSNQPYNTKEQSFFVAPTYNTIFYPNLSQVYTPTTVETRQYNIVHYYSVNYLPESDINPPLDPSLISSNDIAQKPYTLTTTQGEAIPGYTYSASNTNIQFSKGVIGFSFIPQEGIWDLKQIMFRSAIQDSNNDPNRFIKYLGVYLFSDILDTNTFTLSMSTAIYVLSNTSNVTFTSNTPSSYGFDVKGGTYYSFSKDTGFQPQYYSTLLGVAQNPKTFMNQPDSQYMVIPFNNEGTVLTIKALSGSAIPYPYYNSVFVSTNYLDGTPPYDSNLGLVFPSTIGQTNWPFATLTSTLYAPIFDETQSQYVLSQPIGATTIIYKEGQELLKDNFYFLPWNLNTRPSEFVATIPGYLVSLDTQVNVYKYDYYDVNRSFGQPVLKFTTDEVFGTYSFTNLVGITGNSSYIYFLGLSNTSNNPNTSYIRIKQFNPINGTIDDLSLNTSYRIPSNGTIQSFSYNDYGQMTLIYKLASGTQTNVYYNTVSTGSMRYTVIPNQSTAIHAIDPYTSTIYWLTLGEQEMGTTVYKWNLTEEFPGTPYTIQTTTGESYWNSLAVNAASVIPASNDRLFFTNTVSSYQDSIYYTTEWNETSITVNPVSTSFQTTTESNLSVECLRGGYRGAIWVTTQGEYNIWGNRNVEVDISGKIKGAYQIFYPFQKIILEKVANTYYPILDTTRLKYPESMHTQLFYYPTNESYTNDTLNKWGSESSSNFLAADTQFQGYYFNTYINAIPLRESSDADYQYIVLRGFTPTESSEVLVRFNLPERYDFGYITSKDLYTEIELASVSTSLFNINYAITLSNFDAQFNSDYFYGKGLIDTFGGSNIHTSNFKQFAETLSSIYGTYASGLVLVSSVNGYVQDNLTNFIKEDLQYILPPSALTRQTYTASLTFNILWQSSLLPQYASLFDNWGLGYNLGFKKEDTGYNTFHQATSFYKILEDYIYLRLNPQYQINRMDMTYKEDLSLTRDSTGQVNVFFGKLLLGDFNTYSRTFVSNQVSFNPPISKLETAIFQWTDILGNIINNDSCDWSASFVITEIKKTATSESTLPELPVVPPPGK